MKSLKLAKFNTPQARNQKLFLSLAILGIVITMVASYFDPTIFAKAVLVLLFFGISWFLTKFHVRYGIYALVLWFAFEPIILKIIPQDLVVYARYLPEVFLYTLLITVLLYKFTQDKLKFIKTPINLAFFGFILIGIISAIINQVEPFTAILGIRQLIRFVFVFYLVIYSDLSRSTIKKITYILIFVVIVQALLSFAQVITHGALDHYLIPAQDLHLSENIIIQGVEQIWEEGQRVFGTFGRYNQLGSFLALMVALIISFLYEFKFTKSNKNLLRMILLAAILTIVFTYSRASWIAALAAIGLIAIIIKKDKRFIMAISALAVIMLIYIGSYVVRNQLAVSMITEQREATLIERALEPFSKASLRGSYDGFGRIYFLVNTPMVVVPHSPVVGVGPGQYGGGVAAALGNKDIYNELGLPFGVYGEIGQIDNNWFSIWGEFGTLGVILFGLIFVRLYKAAKDIYKNIDDRLIRTFALSLRGMIVVVVVLGLFSPYFEMRTLMFYFWLIAGCTFSLAYKHLNNQKNN